MTEFQVSIFQFRITTRSAAETQRLAAYLGMRLESPLVIAMTGDLGSGKTTFVQGLARGLDIPESCYITSPTFTLVNEYPGRLKLFHVDLYRIDDPLDTEDFGLFEILRSEAVVAIEWAERLGEELPTERLDVGLETVGAESRTVSFRGYGSSASDLLHKMKNRFEESPQ
jgi:tRNA threonylcarbamoyladenosine biosynthesis protein TsaE